MNTTETSRHRILEAIRAGTRTVTKTDLPAAYSALPRTYLRAGTLSSSARIELLIERLREYEAEVTECAPDDLPAAIAAKLAASGKRIFAAPIGLPPSWMPPRFEWRVDRGLTHSEIEQAQGVVTAAFCAIADSGTIVLHHGPTEGRRVLTLLPDWHLCILRASQIVECFPEYIARCATPPTLATTISGPSATADIEMTRITGVHGPRFLHVILVHDESIPLEHNLDPSQQRNRTPQP